MYACMHTLAYRRGVPSSPQHPGTTSLVTAITDKKGLDWGRWIQEGVRSDGERVLSSGGADRGGERSTSHMLPFTVLVCSVNPGFCCFPLECRRADSQSGSSSIFATATHKLVPKLLLRRCRKRHGERCLVWRFGNTSSPLSHPHTPPSLRVSECTSIKQSSKYRERHEERSTAVLYRHLEVGSVEILIGLTHKQTQRCTHEFIQKAAQGDGPDLSFSKVTALLCRNNRERLKETEISLQI